MDQSRVVPGCWMRRPWTLATGRWVSSFKMVQDFGFMFQKQFCCIFVSPFLSTWDASSSAFHFLWDGQRTGTQIFCLVFLFTFEVTVDTPRVMVAQILLRRYAKIIIDHLKTPLCRNKPSNNQERIVPTTARVVTTSRNATWPGW